MPNVFIRLFRLLAAFGALGLPLALMVREIVRGYTRRLLEALATALLAIGITVGLNHLIATFPSSALYEALTHLPGGVAARPLDSYLAALFAFSAVVGVADEALWRRLLGAVSTVYVLAAFTSTQASLLSLLLSATLGVVVGIAVRYVAGSVNERPDGYRIAAALAQRDLPVVRLEAAGAAARRPPGLPGDDGGRRPAAGAGVRPRTHRVRRDLQPLPRAPAPGRARPRPGALPGAGDRAPVPAGNGRAERGGAHAAAARRSALWARQHRARLRVAGGRTSARSRRPDLDALWGHVNRLHQPASRTAG